MPGWLVSLEAFGTREIDVASLGAVTDVLAEIGDVASYADGRYVVRLLVPGREPADALKAAKWLWDGAIADAGLPPWPVIRAEVVEPVDPPVQPASAAKPRRRARRSA